MARFSLYSIKKKLSFTTLSILTSFFFFYYEHLTYWMLPLKWLKQPNCESPYCQKILLISDPQIIGPEWNLEFLDIITEWDSDRYIRKTFLAAVNYLKPDVIIFLGDLMDQGVIATDSEYDLYLTRLKDIFALPESLTNTLAIYLPGDNDVGGIDDILIPSYVDRFNKLFNQSEESILTDFVEYCKVNLMTSTIQQSKVLKENIIRVALSHAPLIKKETVFLQAVLNKIKPHIIFTGHLHKAFHYSTFDTDVWSFQYSAITPRDNKLFTYKFHEGFIHEIIVPTCSYRMGVEDMGYGSAFIDTKQKLVHFNVLWLPDRFKQLYMYCFLLIIVIFKFFYWFSQRQINLLNYHQEKLIKHYKCYP